MAWLIAGFALLGALILLSRWFMYADVGAIKKVLKWLIITATGGLILFLLLRGQLTAVLGALPAVLLFFLRWGPILQRLRNLFGPSPGRSSKIRTETLEMRLDHDRGHLDGRVLRGPFGGQALDTLSLDDLQTLLDHCRNHDLRSVPVLQAYLDHRFGSKWRGRGDTESGSGEDTSAKHGRDAAGNMTREEAYEILGLDPGAGEKQIRAAHSRLMQKLHPDRGGSNWLAARINHARDVLLGRG